MLFFHDIFENSLFALGHGTVCRSCLSRFKPIQKKFFSQNLLFLKIPNTYVLNELNWGQNNSLLHNIYTIYIYIV